VMLQDNHEKNHIFFNADHFHNHCVHHLLTLFALGASPEEIQKAYDANKSYQLPRFPVEVETIEDMSDEAKFRTYLGQEKFFHDYVVFFEKEIEKKGWQAVVNEYVFSRSENAELILTRMFGGTHFFR